MAGVHHHVITEGEQPVRDRVDDRLERAERAPGGAGATVEERVAGEHHAQLGRVQADRARRVPRRVQHLQRGAGDLDGLTVRQRGVGRAGDGGGLTVGKSKITDGFGEFANVYKISDVMGSYATGEAHAGAGASAKAQVMTNGKVSLALAGKGEGWDLGVAFGKFTLTPK